MGSVCQNGQMFHLLTTTSPSSSQIGFYDHPNSTGDGPAGAYAGKYCTLIILPIFQNVKNIRQNVLCIGFKIVFHLDI